jgi:hypothetical protein
MAVGLKTIETRHWRPGKVGLVAIHAAKRWQGEEREWAAELAEIYNAPLLANPPLGAIVATGLLVRVARTEDLLPTISEQEEMFGNYGPNRFGWIFEDIVALPEPVACKGAQGWFEVPDDLTELTLAATAAIKAAAQQQELFG